MINYTIGQRLYMSSSDNRGSGRWLIVKSIRRKWVELAREGSSSCIDYRVEKDSVRIDGGEYMSPGILYLDEQAYLDEQRLQDKWSTFRRSIECQYQIPEGLLVDGATKMNQIEIMLFGKRISND
jgi:hypothetical protein